ncbi:phage major capsid protein [Ehrlichia canis]|uniref:Phage major capsid protein, HK97 family n=1 Tax=Ehrlichia canis (strain Jake) TaxID=269484 RepID=A0ACA6AVF0_EHRCJ|nr:phage major capsid protein [Ehrlichia canis]AAZ68303.1 Phage major capsid protein, HK97 family [Ehrlichia canis str. Jake]AUO54935.1 phage major capsid protein [Ehrlichia canis]UKC53233.1 phage major capsid protein [Ehrlichia canis]UKC54170.1 phage major capsid protein [Ehrlichia canis]UKC55106.1 phage major capsid protein [Ehrlichia canis]
MTTSTLEIQESLNNLTASWEEFKTQNEKKLSDISAKSAIYPSILEKLEKTENILDIQNQRLDQLEISSQRPITYDNKHYNEDHNYKMFTQYLCKGIDEIKSATEEALDESYSVPHNISSYIEKNLTQNSVMRQLCSIEKISGDSLDCFISDNNQTNVNWRTSSQDTDETKPPKIDKVTINLHELYAQPKITKKLLEDSTIDIASWLINHLVDAFSRAENTAFISGDGNNKPYGILTYAKEENTIESKTLNSDTIIKLYYSLDEYFATKAAFIMHRSVLEAIRSLKLTSGQYIWHPGLTPGNPDTLMGLPVYQTSDMPQLNKKSLPIIALADFKNAYKIVENRSIRTLRDPFTSKPFVKFYTTKRVGGAVINDNAIRFLKITE